MEEIQDNKKRRTLNAYFGVTIVEIITYIYLNISVGFLGLSVGLAILTAFVFIKRDFFGNNKAHEIAMSISMLVGIYIFIEIATNIFSYGIVFMGVSMLLVSAIWRSGVILYYLVFIVQLIFSFTDYYIPENISGGIYTFIKDVMILSIMLYYLLRVEDVKKHEKNGELELREEIEFIRNSKNEFLANVSHELKTPVNVITGLLEQEIEGDVCVDKEKLSEVIKNSKRLSRMIDNIIEYSLLESKQVELNCNEYSISEVMDRILLDALKNKKAKYLDIIVNIRPSVPKLLYGDSNKIEIIIRNIFDNALKFTYEGNVYVDIRARKERYGVNLNIEITDTGIGMSGEEQERIFGLFNQADSSLSRNFEGLGLSLSIVKGFLNLMKGVIYVDAKPNKGTKVSVSIPQEVINDGRLWEVEDADKKNPAFFSRVHGSEEIGVLHRQRQILLDTFNDLNIPVREYNTFTELFNSAKLNRLTHLFIRETEWNEFEKEWEAFPANIQFVVLKSPLTTFNIIKALNKKGDIFIDFKNQKVNTFKGKNVLSVDDNPLNYKVLEGYLKQYEVNLDYADSGKEALRKLENKSYDLIFMDQMMPGMDGITCYKKIREMDIDYCKTIPIIALTANYSSVVKKEILGCGFAEYMTKPIDIQKLDSVMNTYLSGEDVNSVKQTEKTNSEGTIKNESKEILKKEKEVLVNKKAGIELSCNSVELYREILKVYLDESGDNIEKLDTFLSENNLKEYAVIAHAIKSNSKQIGADSLFEFALSMEMSAKEGNKDYINDNHKAFIDRYKCILDYVRTMEV